MTPRRLRISSGSEFEKNMSYCRAVVDDDWVFHFRYNGFRLCPGTISNDVVEQANQCLLNITWALTEAGADFKDVVRVRYILPRRADFERCWPVLRRYFSDSPPAATMIEAGLSDERMKIEIEVTARRAVPNGSP